MRNTRSRADRRFTRLLIAAVVATVLAVMMIFVAIMNPAFNFHKAAKNIMPDLIGMTEEEAYNAIKAAGGADPTFIHDYDDAPNGTVIEQGLPKGETVVPNQVITVRVSKGPVSQVTTNAHEGWVSVPDLTNATVDNAEKVAQQMNLKIVVGEYVFNDSVNYGAICQQSPARGISVAPGSEIHVNLSKGPQIVRYTITVNCGSGGTVSPSGTQTVEKGKSVSFTITPDEGYVIDTVLVDNKPIDPTISFKFSDVDSNHTLSVTFREEDTGFVIF